MSDILNERILLNARQIEIITTRLAAQILENMDEDTDFAIIGLQPRGVYFSEILKDKIIELGFGAHMKYGELDTTFHRDDFRRGEILKPSENNINFIVENTHVILVDDVLYTGRTVRAALDALNAYGRPKKVELLALVDRMYSREIPISASYVGVSVDTRANDKVKVNWHENKKDNQVLILTQQI